MKVPKSMMSFTILIFRVGIPMTYVFMFVGLLFGSSMVAQGNWLGAFWGVAFMTFAFLIRSYFVKVLDSLERTGTTFKWERKQTRGEERPEGRDREE